MQLRERNPANPSNHQKLHFMKTALIQSACAVKGREGFEPGFTFGGAFFSASGRGPISARNP